MEQSFSLTPMITVDYSSFIKDKRLVKRGANSPANASESQCSYESFS